MHSLIIPLLSIILILLLVVGIHEAAHALVAWFFGIKIKRISLGFGRPLLSWKSKSGCEWVWALWPLGGYVHMFNTRIAPVEAEDYVHCFDKKPVWIRIIVLLAGSIANFIFGFLALVLVFSAGLYEDAPLVASVKPDSIAAKAGMIAGDSIVSIAGKPVESWRTAGMRLIISTGKADVPLIVSSNSGEIKSLSLDLRVSQSNQKKQSLLGDLGIIPEKDAPKIRLQAGSFMEACSMSAHFITDTVIFMIKVLLLLITKVLPFSVLLGPLGMFSLTIASFLEGFIAFLFFSAGFSIAVGFVNLFPIPGLDGGSILYALIEKIRGTPVSVAMEILLHRFAMIIAGLLLIQLLLNDVEHRVGGMI